MQGAMMAVGVMQLINGQVPVGVIFACIIIFQFAMKPIDQVIGAWDDYHLVKESARRINHALLRTPEPVTSTLQFPGRWALLAGSDVSFVPPGSDKPILKRISFTLQAGQSSGLVGSNGSGKTTLARILTGSVGRPPVRYAWTERSSSNGATMSSARSSGTSRRMSASCQEQWLTILGGSEVSG